MNSPYRITYCAKCAWNYPGNSHAVGLANECPDCGYKQLSFIQDVVMEEVLKFAKERLGLEHVDAS
tara:strand:+ start:246 stop:443 length:198 start_codon:yes stop_codon:yes gene_type:complete